mgnify:CR=1 FL=1
MLDSRTAVACSSDICRACSVCIWWYSTDTPRSNYIIMYNNNVLVMIILIYLPLRSKKAAESRGCTDGFDRPHLAICITDPAWDALARYYALESWLKSARTAGSAPQFQLSLPWRAFAPANRYPCCWISALAGSGIRTRIRLCPRTSQRVLLTSRFSLL